ncbi:spindle and kinetochore-associated protein 2-like isoform X1 [Liolophura sinensis]|uniref:spindle and kinetochore-associated protein 2-like isoform X1 n=1 Tax=Liolophura sinensis TaxID=3198878 RepID=UPI0031581CF4
MEETVDKLEAMFQKADSDLSYLSRKLDFEYGQHESGEGQVNPQQLMQKVGQVKKDYAAIVKDVQGIQQAQQEAMEYFRDQLSTACEMLNTLQSQTGNQENGEPPDFAALEKLLGVKLPLPSPTWGDNSARMETTVEHGHQAHSNEQPAEASQTTVVAASGDTKYSRSKGGKSAVASVFELSLSERRKDSAECIEVTQEEFESVSSLVRGRVRLVDVNHTYQRLWQHFIDEGNSEDLSTQDMHKMGLKVTGATGEAKLKVLKSLKLITMTKKGNVNMVKG